LLIADLKYPIPFNICSTYLRIMINKKVQVWLPLLFSLTMIAGMFLGYNMRDNMPGKKFFSTEKRRPLQEIMDLIKSKYVDEVKVENLMDTAIQAVLNKLDPHSVFIPATDLQSVNDDLAGNFFGVGLEFNIIDDTINITNVLKDGPSQIAGLATGDKIIKVGDSTIAGIKLTTEKVRKLLRGERGTKVAVTILRGTQNKIFNIKRDVIPISSIDAAYMIDSAIGYIKINKFTLHTYKDFMESLVNLQKQKLQKLIVDLRGNGGGILEEAVEIADEFLSGDKLITYTEGFHNKRKEYKCRRPGLFETGKLVMMVDEGTASASEILIGALQDWDRATVVGRRSFGKGLVQEQFDLSDNSALRLTIARYYTPIGRSIQRPYANGEKAYYDEVSNRYNDGETQFADSTKNDTTKMYKTKAGKKVYGGGGISPDYFVAIDTSGYSPNLAKMYTKNTISNFTYRYYLQHMADLNKYKTPATFVSNYQFSETDMQRFIAAASKDSIYINQKNAKEIQTINKTIKTAIARQLYRNEGFYQSVNANDGAIKKAVEVLK
jgi:carboxyl-terminal processing protease